MRISLTKDWVSTKKRLEEERQLQQKLEAKVNAPISKYEEVQMKKKVSNRLTSAKKHDSVGGKKPGQPWEGVAKLEVPEFYD